MKTVILDTCTVTKGDLDMSPLSAFGEVEYYDILTPEKIIEVLAFADAVVCNKSVIDRRIIDATNLKFIGVFATGYNNIDIEYAREKGIVVCNVPGYSTDSVTQVTWSFILELASSTSKYAKSVANGDWKKASYFTYFDFPITELAGKTLGIYGLGTIGLSVARVGLALGMKIIAYTRTPKTVEGIELVSEDELFKKSDFLTFHCPLNEKTAKIVNERTLSLMKPTAFLINTARGGVIDEQALADALKNGVIAGAALDVLTYEPMAEDCPLWGIDNCMITPHVAWASLESRTRLIGKVAGNLKAFYEGNPINVVNK
ncbi:MAG: D-2-hydroxyacid dehydrogenase [Ruminococcaceae bacterium]|nr:D-2-hydroxyacid dehydrogenase [Oscillospiraceae bacterium]